LLVTIGVASAALALSRGDAGAGLVATPTPFPFPVGSNSANASGWVGGAHAGYNWQQGQAVFGFETDLQWTGLRSFMSDHLVANPPGPLPAGSFAETIASIDWYGTLRGRVGYAAGPWLFYGTGGLAYGGVGLSSNFGVQGVLTTGLVNSQLRTGWVGGAGFEYLWNPNVSFSLLYQYVDLGRLSGASGASFAAGPFTATVSQSASAHAQFQTVMAGVTWHFAPMPTGPWSGAYVGGQAGGAWGNSASANYNSAATILLFSDIRLKRDVALVGRRDDGLGLYSFKYLWSDTTYVGVMAQEVALVHPEAVVRDALSGYLAVDYGRLGLSLMTLQ
jgi:outer membrane immunogenic protein